MGLKGAADKMGKGKLGGCRKLPPTPTVHRGTEDETFIRALVILRIGTWVAEYLILKYRF